MEGSRPTVHRRGLVLGRREGESVHLRINDRDLCVVEIVAIDGRQVRVRFIADDEVSIVRAELLDADATAPTG